MLPLPLHHAVSLRMSVDLRKLGGQHEEGKGMLQ